MSASPYQPTTNWKWAFAFLALTMLTAASFILSNSPGMLEQRSTRTVLLVAISVLKALIVVLSFMHFWWEKSWKYLVTVPALIFGGILTISLIPDVGLRNDHYSSLRLRFLASATTNDDTKQEQK